MTPNDPTFTHTPEESGDSSEAAWDAGIAAAFGPGETGSHHPAADPEAGTILAGKYRLSERIGEGGMGSVWVAHQSEPVKRKVAVKLIKAGMDSKSVLARFEAERQALAVMDHPNIAKVLDGGLHDGRPFFVMELVKGVPITEYCDARKLTPRQRLELFVPVCQAIQHAHQKGIIHRDIKPSNVLIALYDDKPVPKVIDFGVAKATGGTLTEQTIETAFGGVVGTPQYMSPEQASLNNLDIDTRSDVYSLGVLLYELLTGTTPFSGDELKKKGLLEILRVVREEEPPRPSTRLSTADALPSLSASRGTEPKKLTGLLRNELDWIVMKALEKDRARRYETANGFAADVLRYLSGEPVQAHPPSRAYQLKKFVRRNKGKAIAASLVLLALSVGVVGTTWGLLEARRQTEVARAEAAAKELARQEEAKQRAKAEANEQLAGERLVQVEAEKKNVEAEKQKAEKQKRIAESVKDFLRYKLLAQADVTVQADTLVKAGGAAGEAMLNPTVRELLDRAAKELAPDKIEPNFPNQPLVQAQLLETVGQTYRGIGEAATAIDFLTRAADLFRRHLGPDRHDTRATLSNLANAYNDAGDPVRGVKLLEQLCDANTKNLGADDPDTLTTMNNLASGYLAIGKVDLALPLLEETLKRRKARLGPDNGQTLTSMNNLAMGYKAAGRFDLALPLFKETLKLTKTNRGPDHPVSVHSMSNLAACYQDAGKSELALPLFEETFKRRKDMYGLDDRQTFHCMNSLAACHWSLLQLDKSIPLFEELLRLQEKKLGRDHPDTQFTIANLGVNYRDAGRVAEAIPMLEEVHRASKKFGNLRVFVTELVDAYAKAGKPVEAAKLIDELLADTRKSMPKDSPQRAKQLAACGLTLLELKAFAQAQPLLRESLAIREKTQPDAWTTFNTQSMLGGALLGQKNYKEAEPLLLKGYEEMNIREKTMSPEARSRISEALDRLIELYTATNKPDEVKKWRAERAKYPVPVEKGPMPREKK